MLGKEDGGLPGRIAAAHQHHLRSLVDMRLVVSGGVEYAPPFELLAPFGVQAAILDARGDQQALCGDRFVAVQPQHRIGLVEHQAAHRRGHRETRAKFVGLKKDRKSTRLNSSHLVISYAVFCLKKKKKHEIANKE